MIDLSQNIAVAQIAFALGVIAFVVSVYFFWLAPNRLKQNRRKTSS